MAEVMRPLHRVVVIGCPGVGKTRFSAKLAQQIGAQHIVRDRLGPPCDGYKFILRLHAARW